MSLRIIVYVAFIIETVGGQICVNPPDFANYCTSQYAGFTVGGRCFFLARNSLDKSWIGTPLWNNAFDVCKSQGDGAVLAQLYTKRELSAFNSTYYATQFAVPYMWIALRNLVAVASTPGTPTMNADTHYYSNATTYDAKISTSNSFLRNHVNDDDRPGNGECFALFLLNAVAYVFGDVPCDTGSDRPHLVLCMITNGKQSFALTTGCFMEQAGRSETTTTADECATVCATQTWCRTFNYHALNQTCDFFALHTADASTSITYGIADCHMYTAIA